MEGRPSEATGGRGLAGRPPRLAGASVAATVTGGLSGCATITDPLTGGTDGAAGLSAVPRGASAVARGDVTTILNDSAVATFVEEILDDLAQGRRYAGPTDLSGLLERFSAETRLDPNGASTAVGFARYPERERRSRGSTRGSCSRPTGRPRP